MPQKLSWCKSSQNNSKPHHQLVYSTDFKIPYQTSQTIENNNQKTYFNH